MTTTSSERVYTMREKRKAMGLRRLELYAHPDDWKAIKALAKRLQEDRFDPKRNKWKSIIQR